MDIERKKIVLTQVEKDIAKIKDAVVNGIQLTYPIAKLYEKKLIYPNAITLIQGKTGVHKSRLAGVLASLFINLNADTEYLGMKRNSNKKFGIVYFDTERSITEVFPQSIKDIISNAGLNTPNYDNVLKHVSLVNVSREERTEIIKLKLEELNTSEEICWVIILDVITDCVSDFNNAEASMKLIDTINELINNCNMTFICLIHENPTSIKARGHLGTELLNKASTCLQISKQDKMEHVLRIENIKNRGEKTLKPIYCEFSELNNSLTIVNKERIKEIKKGFNTELELLKRTCYEYLMDKKEGVFAKEFKQYLIDKTNVSESTVTSRLNQLIDKTITHIDGVNYTLKNKGNTKSSKYFIEISN